MSRTTRRREARTRRTPVTDYLAAAEHGAPAVVVVHDWFGLLPEVMQQCDDLAAAGYTALGVDLYDGRTAGDPAEAESMMGGLRIAAARDHLAAAVRRLRGSPFLAPRIAAVGFSMGGWLALHAAAKGQFDAIAAYYAVLEPPETVPMPCPVQLHLAAVDEWDPADAPALFVQALRAGGTPVDATVYPATEHSFANGAAAEFAPDAAAKAWEATLEFLTRTLG
ncbi:MAG: alpha/beta fold hydrolase [Nitriliruptorales bacterium]|nr:alpha/beta fold hydrolase [Nitriliruptorales bacterium]